MKIALLQLEDAHHFCLPSQAMLLAEAGHEVHLAYPAAGRAKVEGMPGVSGHCWHRIDEGGGWRAHRELGRWLRQGRFDRVLFNTAHGNPVRNFLLLHPWLTAAGVLHEVKTLSGSLSQRLISLRMHHYLPLNDLMVEEARQVTRVPVTAFYPIFMPPVPPAPRDPAHLVLIVPGQLEQKRRDYRGLFRHLDRGLDPRVRLVLLGSGRPDELAAIRADAERAGIGGQVEASGAFVDETAFQARMASCDAILPLIHPGNAKGYFQSRVTGAHLLAPIHRKPMLLHESLRERDEERVCSLPYALDGLQALLSRLAADRAELAACAAAIAAYPVFQRDEQRRRLLRALELPDAGSR